MADAPPPGSRPPPQDLHGRCVVITGTGLYSASTAAVDRLTEATALEETGRGPSVADWLFAIAFDQRFRPPSVVWRLPDERPRPPAPATEPVDSGPTR